MDIFIQTLLQSADMVLTPNNLLIIPLGLLIGTIVGAIPGLSAPMGTSLVLPFTFFMEPITAILLLLGVYKGGIYGGSIPAILFNIPGTVASSCTTLDGYPLTRKGQSRKALEVALYASVIADVVSNFTLILLTGYLANFALHFGAPETFSLIFFSLFVIAGISGDQLFRGILTALLGLFVATIGIDNFHGTQRLTFGHYNLYSGFSVLPLLMGLFAFSEILYRLILGEDSAKKILSHAPGGERLRFKEFILILPTILRSSLIGSVLGAIPGIGAAPAAFFSYGEARRRSKNKEAFGNGSLEGIAASEAANNAVCASSFIPVLALGIPGGTAAAIIMAAFMVHGISPGPILFKTQLDFVYALYPGLMFGSAVLLIIGLMGIRVLSRLVNVPSALLIPSVMVLCILGSYASNGGMFDVYVMVAAGVLGLIFRVINLPLAPFLIGFILGPLLESSFRDTLLQGGYDVSVFFRSWIAVFFWVLSVVSIFFVFRRHIELSREKVKK